MKKFNLALSILVLSSQILNGEVIEWCDVYFQGGDLFETPATPADLSGPAHKRVQFYIEEEGWSMISTGQSDFGKGDIIIFHNTGRHVTPEMLNEIPAKKILVQWEPPTVFSHLHNKEYENCFDKIITWNHRKVDGDRYLPICYPVMRPMNPNLPLFEDRKLVCMIHGNKNSDWATIDGIQYDNHPRELYTTRKRLIEFYERNPSFSFDLYGWNWEKENYNNYIEAPQDKLAVLKNYRFSYAYENYRNNESYITEKIFDCFVVGTIPIYLGATNVAEIIPENCFIDARKFPSYESLYLYIESMTEELWLEYQNNIRAFLNSPSAKSFTTGPLVETILGAIFDLETNE